MGAKISLASIIAVVLLVVIAILIFHQSYVPAMAMFVLMIAFVITIKSIKT